MTLTYRTRRRLQRIGIVALAVLVVLVLAWFCWVIWLERYVVYTRDGATINFDIEIHDDRGVLAKPPAAKGNVPIYFNEGTDAIEVSRELLPLDGYYISYEDLSKDIAGVMDYLQFVKTGTPVMIELKGGYGSFYYSSKLQDAIESASVPVASVDELIDELKHRGFYLIAKVSSLADYNFGLNHVPSGLYMLSRAGLWQDPNGGYYWMNPTDGTALSWISSVVNEVKSMGFHEVMLSNFRFPVSDKYIFNGDKNAALQSAMETILKNCQTDTFAVSFGVDSASFPIPEEARARIYLENVDASSVSAVGSQMQLENPDARLVFLAPTNDTRYNLYSVLHPISAAEVLEAQKADMAANED